MSQALLLRISALESRVAALEGRLEIHEDRPGIELRRTFQSKFDVYKDGEKLNAEPLPKAEAERLAESA